MNPLTRSQAQSLNRRRLDLITKKNSEGLTDDETAELARVKADFSTWAAKRFPRETVRLDEHHERIQRLKELRAKLGR